MHEQKKRTTSRGKIASTRQKTKVQRIIDIHTEETTQEEIMIEE